MTETPGRSPAELQQILETLEAAAERKTFRRIDFFAPYPKQSEFLGHGRFKR